MFLQTSEDSVYTFLNIDIVDSSTEIHTINQSDHVDIKIFISFEGIYVYFKWVFQKTNLNIDVSGVTNLE